jgi:hypothetical protein
MHEMHKNQKFAALPPLKVGSGGCDIPEHEGMNMLKQNFNHQIYRLVL